jgi:hypothetical protein
MSRSIDDCCSPRIVSSCALASGDHDDDDDDDDDDSDEVVVMVVAQIRARSRGCRRKGARREKRALVLGLLSSSDMLPSGGM